VTTTESGIHGTVRAHIRTAHPHEWTAVGELTYLGFGHGVPGARQPDPERLALLRDAAGRAAAGDLLVAADPETDELLGTASLLRPGTGYVRQAYEDEAELRLLAVLPQARRRGVGDALMREALRRARSWSVRALVLDTGPRNGASRALYEGLGFVRVRLRETRPASSGDLLVVYRYAFDD
jgi:ribosomal protein S18 acetylase RimI-like enzyme